MRPNPTDITHTSITKQPDQRQKRQKQEKHTNLLSALKTLIPELPNIVDNPLVAIIGEKGNQIKKFYFHSLKLLERSAQNNTKDLTASKAPIHPSGISFDSIIKDVIPYRIDSSAHQPNNLHTQSDDCPELRQAIHSLCQTGPLLPFYGNNIPASSRSLTHTGKNVVFDTSIWNLMRNALISQTSNIRKVTEAIFCNPLGTDIPRSDALLLEKMLGDLPQRAHAFNKIKNIITSDQPIKSTLLTNKEFVYLTYYHLNLEKHQGVFFNDFNTLLNMVLNRSNTSLEHALICQNLRALPLIMAPLEYIIKHDNRGYGETANDFFSNLTSKYNSASSIMTAQAKQQTLYLCSILLYSSILIYKYNDDIQFTINDFQKFDTALSSITTKDVPLTPNHRTCLQDYFDDIIQIAPTLSTMSDLFHSRFAIPHKHSKGATVYIEPIPTESIDIQTSSTPVTPTNTPAYRETRTHTPTPEEEPLSPPLYARDLIASDSLSTQTKICTIAPLHGLLFQTFGMHSAHIPRTTLNTLGGIQIHTIPAESEEDQNVSARIRYKLPDDATLNNIFAQMNRGNKIHLPIAPEAFIAISPGNPSGITLGKPDWDRFIHKMNPGTNIYLDSIFADTIHQKSGMVFTRPTTSEHISTRTSLAPELSTQNTYTFGSISKSAGITCDGGKTSWGIIPQESIEMHDAITGTYYTEADTRNIIPHTQLFISLVARYFLTSDKRYSDILSPTTSQEEYRKIILTNFNDNLKRIIRFINILINSKNISLVATEKLLYLEYTTSHTPPRLSLLFQSSFATVSSSSNPKTLPIITIDNLKESIINTASLERANQAFFGKMDNSVADNIRNINQQLNKRKYPHYLSLNDDQMLFPHNSITYTSPGVSSFYLFHFKNLKHVLHLNGITTDIDLVNFIENCNEIRNLIYSELIYKYNPTLDVDKLLLLPDEELARLSNSQDPYNNLYKELLNLKNTTRSTPIDIAEIVGYNTPQYIHHNFTNVKPVTGSAFAIDPNDFTIRISCATHEELQIFTESLCLFMNLSTYIANQKLAKLANLTSIPLTQSEEELIINRKQMRHNQHVFDSQCGTEMDIETPVTNFLLNPKIASFRDIHEQIGKNDPNFITKQQSEHMSLNHQSTYLILEIPEFLWQGFKENLTKNYPDNMDWQRNRSIKFFPMETSPLTPALQPSHRLFFISLKQLKEFDYSPATFVETLIDRKLEHAHHDQRTNASPPSSPPGGIEQEPFSPRRKRTTSVSDSSATFTGNVPHPGSGIPSSQSSSVCNL